MSSWLCNAFCFAQNQSKHEIVMVNNKTETIISFGKSMERKKQIAHQNGFIMLKKSLYNQHLENCQKNNNNFIDQQFPPNDKSISEKALDFYPQLKNKSIIWKRIPQLYKNYQLIKDKIEPSDIQQGNIGDCYFLAALSALAQNENNILQIFGKKDAKSMIKNDFGIYKLVINIAGQPQQILIDDYIPVYSKSQRPVFCKPVNNEFWVVLVQKAWAKINKCYTNIAYGNPHQVLNRFCVAPVFYHNIPSHFYQQNQRINSWQVDKFELSLWDSVLEGQKQNFAMCCGSRQKVYIEGIKPAHSYTLLGVYQLLIDNKKVKLLKLRNPWGHTEYSGNYSQCDRIWDKIDSKIKNSILQKKQQQNDGIFIIPFDQFLRNFQSIDISHSKAYYNYIYKPFILTQSEPSFYCVTVQNEGQVYITFQRNLTRDFNQNQYENSGVSKILVAQEIQNGKFQFVDCALQTSLADVTVRCKKLKPGNYILLVQNQDVKNLKQKIFLGKSNKKGTLSVYSSTICSIQQIPKIKNFIYQFFYTHAIKYNKDKKNIGSSGKDWIAKKLLQSSGYGYVCINLDEKGSKVFMIQINENLISSQGFRIQLPSETLKNVRSFNSNQIQLDIYPGQVLMFLFKIDFKSQHLAFSFPPKGFDIKKII